jgi:hypothetical protein
VSAGGDQRGFPAQSPPDNWQQCGSGLTHVVSAKPATGGTIRPRTFSLGDSFGDPGPYFASDEGYAPFLAFIAFGNSHRLRKFLFVRHPDDLARTEIANFMTSPIQ